MKKKILNVKSLKVQSFVTSMDEPEDLTRRLMGGGYSQTYVCAGGGGGSRNCPSNNCGSWSCTDGTECNVSIDYYFCCTAGSTC